MTINYPGRLRAYGRPAETCVSNEAKLTYIAIGLSVVYGVIAVILAEVLRSARPGRWHAALCQCAGATSASSPSSCCRSQSVLSPSPPRWCAEPRSCRLAAASADHRAWAYALAEPETTASEKVASGQPGSRAPRGQRPSATTWSAPVARRRTRGDDPQRGHGARAHLFRKRIPHAGVDPGTGQPA